MRTNFHVNCKHAETSVMNQRGNEESEAVSPENSERGCWAAVRGRVTHQSELQMKKSREQRCKKWVEVVST